jgi:hypothetical protein
VKRDNRTQLPVAAASEDALLFEQIRELIVTARHSVARGVNLLQVQTNFQIGRHIVDHEQLGQARADSGQELIKVLADKLSAEFGRGFSKSNLEYLRRFFLAYRDRVQIAQFQTGQLPGDTPTQRLFSLGWTHYVFLLGINNSEERSFYEIEAADQGWNLEELKRQFNSGLYERLAMKPCQRGRP